MTRAARHYYADASDAGSASHVQAVRRERCVVRRDRGCGGGRARSCCSRRGGRGGCSPRNGGTDSSEPLATYRYSAQSSSASSASISSPRKVGIDLSNLAACGGHRPAQLVFDIALSVGLDLSAPFECFGGGYRARLQFWLFAPLGLGLSLLAVGLVPPPRQPSSGLLVVPSSRDQAGCSSSIQPSICAPSRPSAATTLATTEAI